MNRAVVFRGMVFLFFVPVALSVVSGCGAERHQLVLKEGYELKPDTGVEVGAITNDSEWEIDIDYQNIFKEAMEKQLKKKKLLWTADKTHKLQLNTRIVQYEKGNAFKRWLWPSMGKTVLEIEGRYKELDETVATCKALRTVEFGGGYTVGAWKSVFKDISKYLVKDLKANIPKK